MTLTSTHRAVILAGIAVVILSGLFPPWTYTFKTSLVNREEPAGYRFIATPPSGRSNLEGVKLDMTRLVLQWALVFFSCCGVLATTRCKNEQND